ncbi:C6 zinc finger domain-containing protein [Colletotrichum karsti]|uniref:C6 zinc finger domain-containing protein n=1 Tax=Colletotrichum karsti TaxID=1095194 RepID=A0A9P6I5H1_9PEZI|nr:C6 zinc finger domain-containing protein [Colletotrichum karsti]KAF9876384.1 C6 zinc finger domain-containing protein [Colletotrichum karsti]
MMTLTLDDNPLSFPLVEHLLYTPSLVHAVQSVSAGQKGFFGATAVQTCLRERGLAIRALRIELRDHELIKPASLLSVFLLGISSSWTEEKPICYGKEHLSGARTLLAKALMDEKKKDDPVIQYILGWYLYWDMTCAFVAEPDDYDASPMNEVEVVTAIERSRTSFHPMIGFSAKLFYNLASVGRHCRRVLATGVGDADLETMLEIELLSWNLDHGDKTLIDMSFAYRNHGLIMLYEIYGRRHQPEVNVYSTMGKEHDLSCVIRLLAMESLKRLLDTPIDAACINFHSMPLLTAGAQLRHDDTRMRVRVVDRFKDLYSTNRIMVNIWAIELLEELWVLRDGGEVISWPELLLSKDWTLNFA